MEHKIFFKRWQRITASVFVVILAMVGSASITLVWMRHLIESPLSNTQFVITTPSLPLNTPESIITLPPTGSVDVQTTNGERLASLAPQEVRPIGSTAKVMTALIVLQSYPLVQTGYGFSISMTEQDVASYNATVAMDGSAVPVTVGEQLNERELLLGLMLPSADNFADILAQKVSGSDAAFVDLMNKRALAMGMAHTHFADPSGYSSQTVSTAQDLVTLGETALRNSVLMNIVQTTQAVLPGGMVINNLDINLSAVPGWLGIKTGSTPAAGGCLLFADEQNIGKADPITIVGAILGQPPEVAIDPAQPELGGAFLSAKNITEQAFLEFTPIDLAAFPPVINGAISTPWGDSTTVKFAPEPSTIVAVRFGETVQISVMRDNKNVGYPLLQGENIGTVVETIGTKKIDWSVITTKFVAPPPWWW